MTDLSLFTSSVEALLLIFNNFFKIPAEPNAQHQLQIWYFRFQAVCILLLPIVGTNFRSFVEKLHHASPSSVLDMLADKILGKYRLLLFESRYGTWFEQGLIGNRRMKQMIKIKTIQGSSGV